jgi:hypothetical protein
VGGTKTLLKKFSKPKTLLKKSWKTLKASVGRRGWPILKAVSEANLFSGGNTE